MTQTSKLPKIKITDANGKRSYIPLTHNVYATQKVGKITPYMCRFMDANAKTKINLETLEYNAPMVSPTVGDIRLKHWLYFVGLDKLCPNFANMLSKMPAVNADGGEFQVEKVPSLQLRELTALCLIGSFCTIYVRNKLNAPPQQSRQAWETGITYLMSSPSEDAWAFENYWNGFAQGQLFNTNTQSHLEPKICITKYASSLLGGMNAFTFNAKYLFLNADINNLTNNDDCIPIPLANPTKDSFLDWKIRIDTGAEEREEPVYNGNHVELTHGLDCSPVEIRNADYAVTRSFTISEGGERSRDVDVTFCFRFSDFGRALRDIMIASGLQLNVASSKRVSFLPYIATYLAYFECQSMQLYKNWQNTAAYKIMRRFETENVWDLSASFRNIQSNQIDSKLFVEFINDLASMWAIEPQDFVAAHTRSPITSPLSFNNLDSFINGVDNEVATQDGPEDAPRVPIDQTDTTDQPEGLENNHLPFIDRIKHDVVTAELLRKLTLRMNVNSIIGRKTINLLRNNGFGEWVDLQKATFIDYGEMRLDLKPVVATADTSTSEGKGADLGQYGGRGYGHKVHKSKTFANKVPGYYILLTTIYVDAGYCQSVDPYNYQTEVDDFYKREYDALGFEIDEKNQVHGSLTFACEGDHGKLDESFGYIPRDTKYKHIHNKLLGYFTDGELKDVYETYQLEKMLPVGLPSFSKDNEVPYDGTHEDSYKFMMRGARFAPSDLPIAGYIWRFLGRFPWLGRFDRIFKLQDYDLRKLGGLYGIDTGANFLENVLKIYSYFICSPENYSCLNTIYFDSWQDKKPISESFGTLSEIFEGFAALAVDKE